MHDLINDPYDRARADRADGPGPEERQPADPDRLVYQGHIAAPGYGVSYLDPVTGEHWIKLGTSWVEPGEGVAELRPEDVI